VNPERPVFVTSLPRAGTTLTLEILARHPELATQRYRDMPFVLAPLLWQQMSGRFRRRGERKERAHGDGMQVSYDSPEAFEEVLWKAFWPQRFKGRQIPLWSERDLDEEFSALFRRHLQKVIVLHAGQGEGSGRYLSKNNANVGRIGLLKRLFPDAFILLPFRDPVQQAASMHRQHLRFLEIHKREPFTRKYMWDLGHLEFGALHRPLAFPGIEGLCERSGPEDLDYWIGYWVLAFRWILMSTERVVPFSYDDLCESGREGLWRLGDSIGLSAGKSLEAAAELLRAPRTHAVDLTRCDPSQLEEAHALLGRLKARACL